MNNNNKDFMRQLSNLDDFYVEEIAEKYPALSKKTKKRILKKCLKKDEFSDEYGNEGERRITVSGTERYTRRHLYRFAASAAAAFVLAVGGITGMFMLNRNFGGDDVPDPDNTPPATSFNDPNSAVTTSRKGIEHWDTNNGTKSVVDRWGTDGTKSDAENWGTNKTEVSQKSYLEGRYFIVIDNGKYNGFEFSLDGTIRPFTFDVPYGNFKRYTGEILGYELIENQFSYGTIGDEANWKTGTIINPNDGTKFSVQFDDNVYTFSKDNSIFEVKISLNETRWDECELNGNPLYGTQANAIEFSDDGFSGHYVIPSEDYTTTDATLIYFTYTQNGDELTFRIGFDTATGKVSSIDNGTRADVMLTLVWADGRTEYFETHNITINPDGSLKYWLPEHDYSAQPPIADTTLNGTHWYEYELDGPTENFIEFGNDGFSGHYGIPPENYLTTDAKLIYLTYTKNGNDIIIYMGPDIANGKLSRSYRSQLQEVMLTLEWADGRTEYLYSHDFQISDLQD